MLKNKSASNIYEIENSSHNTSIRGSSAILKKAPDLIYPADFWNTQGIKEI